MPIKAAVSRNAHGARKLEAVSDLVEIAGTLPPSTAVMAGGERVEDLSLVESARDHGIIDRIVLVGRKDLITESVAKVGIEIPPKDIIPAEGDDEAAAAAVAMAKSGEVKMVLKGSTPTHVLHRHMLPLARGTTVSLVSIFDAAPLAKWRPMIVTDAGVTTVCTYGRIAGLIRNAVDVARGVMLVDQPRVALLSANEKQLPTLPSTRLGADFARRPWPDAFVYGPLSLDLATDPEAVAVKGLPDVPGARDVAGQADILVCPGIDAANVIYKIISAMIKYGEASLANIIAGFPMPYVLLSRSDALETRLNSLALGAIYAQRRLGEQSQGRRARVAKPAAKRLRADITSEACLHAAASQAAATLDRPLEDISLVIVHWAAAATVSALREGKVVDQAFTLEGASADEAARSVAKAVGAMFVAADCTVEAIVLTGATFQDVAVRDALRRRVGRLAPVLIVEDLPPATGRRPTS